MSQSFINTESLNTFFETLTLLSENELNEKIIFNACIQILKDYNVSNLNELFDTEDENILFTSISSITLSQLKNTSISIKKFIDKVKDVITYFNYNEISYQYFCKEHFTDKYPQLEENEDLWPNVCYAIGRNICNGEDPLKEMVESVIEELIELGEQYNEN